MDDQTPTHEGINGFAKMLHGLLDEGREFRIDTLNTGVVILPSDEGYEVRGDTGARKIIIEIKAERTISELIETGLVIDTVYMSNGISKYISLSDTYRSTVWLSILCFVCSIFLYFGGSGKSTTIFASGKRYLVANAQFT